MSRQVDPSADGASGSIRPDRTTGLRLTRLVLAAVFLAVMASAPAGADDSEPSLARLNATAARALAEGDATAALAAAEAAHAAASVEGDVILRATAFDHLATALVLTDGNTARSRALWERALRLLAAHGPAGTAAGLDIRTRLAALEAKDGRTDAAQAQVDRLLSDARGGPSFGAALFWAAQFQFETGDYRSAARLVEEGLSVAPDLLRPAFGAVFVAWAVEEERLTEAGEFHDAAALVGGRIAILRTFMEADSEAMRTLLFGRFALLLRAEAWGPAADALRAWASAGPMTADERGFLDEMASLRLQATELSGYSARREVQLGQAELSVAFAEMLGDPADPRLALALRARAHAETGLGLHEAAAATLARAAALLERGEDGRDHLHLVYADLAANAWQRGAVALASAFYARADAALAALPAESPHALSSMDVAILSTNRAELAVDLGAPDDAITFLRAAREAYSASAAKRALKWNERAQSARIEVTFARALLELGRTDDALAAARRSVTAARDALPDDHPDLALVLGNAADALLALGQTGEAERLLAEAMAINRKALPRTVPQAVELERKFALLQLIRGDLPSAVDVLRSVAEARKGPAYRDALPDAAIDFELLAVTTLAAGGDAGEAIEALQWTGVTRSAEALANLEARLSLDDPSLASLLRRRQDLVEEHRRATSALLAAYADQTADAGTRLSLSAAVDEIEAELGKADGALGGAGLEMTGLAGVDPLDVEMIQSLLGADEAIVLFVLPSLRPDRLSWAGDSTNRVVAITREAVSVASVAEPSRGRLKVRVAAFRCAIAAADIGCRGPTAPTRGAMLLGAEADDLGFDVAAGHALWRDLFGGIDDAIAGKAHLIIVPPADLLDLPFAALPTTARSPDSLAEVDWMIRRHAISILPSVPSLRTLRVRARKSEALVPFLGVADPLIGGGGPMDCDAVAVTALRSAPASTAAVVNAAASGLGLAQVSAIAALPRLPDTACEVAAIDRTLGGASEILLGTGATETAIKALDESGRLAEFRVIVFATHGLVAGEAGASAPGLVLTPPAVPTLHDDGLLTSAEIATLRLNARLVVLSACNTAAGETGDADGLAGLARAFFHAGAQALVVTHWAVYSEAAEMISTGLLAAIQEAPAVTHAEALRRSVQTILDTPHQTDFRLHPSFWAAFAVVGAT